MIRRCNSSDANNLKSASQNTSGFLCQKKGFFCVMKFFFRFRAFFFSFRKRAFIVACDDTHQYSQAALLVFSPFFEVAYLVLSLRHCV